MRPLSLGDYSYQFLFQIRPSVIEEVGFRFGLVVFALHFFGWGFALVAGSIPFGVLHLLNFVSGSPIAWDYIVGTSVAGLFLSGVFLNYGLAAAVLAHWAWNVLASLTAQAFSFPQEALEGARATLFVIVVVSLFLLRRGNPYKNHRPRRR